MLLSILIPTYNRETFLIKNLSILQEYLEKGDYIRRVEIVVSNNNSPDNTHSEIARFVLNNPSLVLRYFLQEQNIGLQNNALFTLKEARGEYVMYLGDDDYLDYEYIKRAIDSIESNKAISLVIPNNFAIDVNGNRISKARDEGYPTRLYRRGFKTCLQHAWRGHQLSGLICKREGLYAEYRKHKIDNIYPFIFFTAFLSLTGETLHLTEPEIRVTMPGQQNKDWNYGDDGLLNEIFDNYKKLNCSQFERTLLQLKIVTAQPFRLWKYKKEGRSFGKAVKRVWLAPNGTFLFKILFPILISYMVARVDGVSRLRKLMSSLF